MKLVPIIGLFIFALFSGALARPVDLSAPQTKLGISDINGFVQIWSDIEGVGVNLSGDSYLPLRYKFTSDPSVQGMLGVGFYVPIFEAKNYLIREKMMKALLPCGKALFLRRSKTEPDSFSTVDGEWKGALKKEEFTVWRDDGWTLVYIQGRLSTLKSDDGHVVSWTYGNGSIANVKKDGEIMISTEIDNQGLVSAFISNGKRIIIKMDDRPILQEVAGQIVVKKLEKVLSEILYPNNKREIYEFGLNAQREPLLTYRDLENNQRSCSWDFNSGYIISESGVSGEWRYSVIKPDQNLGLPAISRTDASGKTEKTEADVKTGTYITQESDGATVTKQVFVSPGPLYNKIQKIEQTLGDKKSLLYQASYDEAGRIIREIDDKGFTKSYEYDANGKLSKKAFAVTKNPEVLAAFQKKESELLMLISSAKKESDKQKLFQKLGMFYVDDMKLPTKALELAAKMSDLDKAYLLKRVVINHDVTLSYQQKLEGYLQLEKEYPDKKDDLKFVIQETNKMIKAGLF